MASMLYKRYCSDFDYYCDNSPNDNNYGVRYGIVALIFISLAALLFIAYFHAQRRIRKNLPPLAYHRWLVSRRQRYNPYPQQNPYNYYNPNGAPQGVHPMYPIYASGQPGAEGFQPPPPAYGNWEPPPPMYQPPQGASKTMANQNVQGVGAEGAAGESSSALPMNGPVQGNGRP